MPMRNLDWSTAEIFVRYKPAISDGGHDTVHLCQPDGKMACVMPFDVFSEYIYDGMRYIKDVQARRSEAAANVVPIRKRRATAHR